MEPVKAKEGRKEETIVSENLTTAATKKFFPITEEVIAGLGVGNENCAVDYQKVLANSNTICKAKVTFHMNVTEAATRQGMIDMVDEISALYPASKPALEFDAGDMVGTHVLSFLTVKTN